MDSDDCATSRSFERQEGMRSGSVSPSTISTASSGSPLVRGHSSSSGKHLAAAGRRPAPTSIAAAQLQCQQQTNRLTAASPTIKSATSSCSSSSSMAPSGRGVSQHSQDTSSGSLKKKKKQHEQENSSSNNNKSFGYNLAKSIAYRAYR